MNRRTWHFAIEDVTWHGSRSADRLKRSKIETEKVQIGAVAAAESPAAPDMLQRRCPGLDAGDQSAGALGADGIAASHDGAHRRVSRNSQPVALGYLRGCSRSAERHALSLVP